MKTLILDKKELFLKVDANSIKLEKKSFPFSYFDLLILNHKISLTSSDILKLTKNNISILILSHHNKNISLIQSANAKNSQLKDAQYFSSQNSLDFAKNFITKKIIFHEKQLQKHSIILPSTWYLNRLKQASNKQEILNLEALYAKKYFKEYFSLFPKELKVSSRSKKPPKDVVNSLLSYFYMLHYYLITTKLISQGFEPSIGYLHKAFREHFALSSDIMELFRSDINELVLQIFKDEILSQEDFFDAPRFYLKYEGRKKIWEHYANFIKDSKNKLKNELSSLRKEIKAYNILKKNSL